MQHTIERLFVYGSLAPGESNEDQLKGLSGTWIPATVTGTVFLQVDGPARGYPAVVLDEDGGTVEGLIFSSGALARHWPRLDAFEGSAYRRVLTSARIRDGSMAEVYIYESNRSRPKRRSYRNDQDLQSQLSLRQRSVRSRRAR